jgi:Anti-anti-sigma regulatory factor (antagonist of anti-sigma factor)
MNIVSVIIPENFVTDEVNKFRKKLIYLLDNGEKKFNIDFSKCNFIDSTGLGVLISINKRCMRLNGSLKLYSVNNPDVIKVFNLARLDKVFEISN